MSSVAAEHAPVSTIPAATTVALRRGALVAIGIGGIVAAVGGGLLVATSDHLVDPVAFGLQLAVMIVGTVSAALYWLVRRPGNRLGWALLALAGATAVDTLQGASAPLLHTTGVVSEVAIFLLTYYVIFAFPDGRVGGLFEKALLTGFSLYFLVAFGPYLFFSPYLSGAAPLAGCGAACPDNAFTIADKPTIAASFGTDMSYWVIALMSATLACLLYRLATATRPRRRALVPVYVPALMLTVPVLLFHGVATQHLSLEAETISDVGWLLTVGRTVLPYGFLLAIVLAAFFAAAALKTIVGRLSDGPTAPQLRAILADALDDPSLEIAFDVDRAGGFIDSSGTAIVPPPVGPTSTPVGRNGDTEAVIMHDGALNADPELVDVAGQALLLALDNDRLAHELQLANAELRATRARIVSAGDSERRKIERDLHDGAQQHLVALRIKVGLASELADPQVARRLADVGAELEEILDELRDLAHGLYPPALRLFGLQEALAGVARRSAPSATLETAGTIGRYPEDVEAAVYFCCVESLQNVGKHAGVGAHAVIRLWQRDGQLCFEVEDDGVGCDVVSASSSGTGYTNMTDRMAGVGGTLVLESTRGRGTTVRGSLPATGPSKG